MSGSKINVAKQAVDFLENKFSEKMIIGIGTGTTVNFFIEQLKTLKHRFDGAVSSSDRSSAILQDAGIKVYELNGVNEIAYYVDGADEVSKDGLASVEPGLYSGMSHPKRGPLHHTLGKGCT